MSNSIASGIQCNKSKTTFENVDDTMQRRANVSGREMFEAQSRTVCETKCPLNNLKLTERTQYSFEQAQITLNDEIVAKMETHCPYRERR